MNVLTADIQAKLDGMYGQTGTPLSDLIGLTIQITSSAGSGAVGRFWQITGETAGPAGQTTLTLLDPTEIPAYWTALPDERQRLDPW